MSLDAFANSMDQMMSAPSGVSNSSLSMRANTDYDMDDFTGRHDHRVGGSGKLSTIDVFFSKWFFFGLIILYTLSAIHVATATESHPAKGYAFLGILGLLVLLPTLYGVCKIIFLLPSTERVYIVAMLLLTTLILVSSVQLRIPHPGLTVMNIAFVILLVWITCLLNPIITGKISLGEVAFFDFDNHLTFSNFYHKIMWITTIWCIIGVILPAKTWLTVVISVFSALTFIAAIIVYRMP